MSYAVSDDGIHWERPRLNLHQVEGIEEENVVLPYGPMHGVFYEPEEEDPQKRFKGMAVVCLRRQGQRGVEGLVIPEAYHLHTSPDGIHWTCDGGFAKPILPYLYGRFYPQTGIGDTCRFWWDPYRHKYIGDVKFVLPGTIRCRGMMESDDLEHWTRATPDPCGPATRTTRSMATRRSPTKACISACAGSTSRSTRMSITAWAWNWIAARDAKYWTRVGAGQPFMALDLDGPAWDGEQMKINLDAARRRRAMAVLRGEPAGICPRPKHTPGWPRCAWTALPRSTPAPRRAAC